MTSDEPGTPSNSRAVSPEGYEKVRARIFFDADILIGQSDAERKLQNRILFSLFFSSKRIELLTTEITRIQVAKNRAEQACDVLRALSSEKFARLASELFSIDIPTMDKGGMHETAYNYYLEKITDETSESNWRCVEYIDDVVRKVFTEYGKKKGFFRDRAKKGQFADAIVFEMLRAEATHETPVIIFSRDKDFSAVDEYDDNIKHVKSWSALIDSLGVRDDIPQAEELVEKHQEFVVEQVRERLLETWNEATEKLGQTQEICQEVKVKRFESCLTGGMIFDSRSADGDIMGEQFLLIGKTGVFFELPNVVPAFVASELGLVDVGTTSESREVADARFDVVFTFIGRRARSQSNVDILEIEFGDGSVRFYADF